jgi:polar amino acid transport system substrate-binding protein
MVLSPRRHRRVAALALPLAALLALSACGSGSDAGTKADATTDATTSTENTAPLFKELPDDIAKAGVIQIGSSVDYPPFEYYAEDGKTLKGFEPELAELLEKQLGVEFNWNNASFDTLFAALKSGRYDIVYGATNDTEEREQSFDFVDYLQSSQGFVTQAGNPAGIKTVDDLCGKSIAAVRGGIQAQYLDKQSKVCTDAGNEKINVLTFAGNAEEQIAVKQGRADAMLENFPTAAAFAAASEGELEVVPDLQVEKQFFGMVVPKESTELRDALQKAWQAIIDDGSYGKVLADWNLSDIAVTEAGVNAVASGTPVE